MNIQKNKPHGIDINDMNNLNNYFGLIIIKDQVCKFINLTKSSNPK
jgi:hypothetical protein